MDMMNEALAAYPWGIYLCLLLAPFVQEDAAVIAAASASSMGLGVPVWLFVSLVVGLSASDLWKYWAGRAARTHHWAERFSQWNGVQSAKGKVLKRLGHTLMAVRFIPGTRIPIYLASGFFKAPFSSFSLWVIVSGMVYAGLTFALFHVLGEVGGEKAKAIVPLIAITILAGFLVFQYVRSLMNKSAAG